MIYERVELQIPIRQGDIFRHVPRVDISLRKMTVLCRSASATEAMEIDWLDAIADDEIVEAPEHVNARRIVRAVVPLAVVDAIVITQDCDALRDEELSFCEIGRLPEIWTHVAQTKSLSRWAELLTRQGSEQIKFFYLPPDPNIVAYPDRMAVDFSSVLFLPRTELESLRHLRVGRLNSEAYLYFREKLSEYFRRYPVDPWCPLNKEEFLEYSKSREGVAPRPWQE